MKSPRPGKKLPLSITPPEPAKDEPLVVPDETQQVKLGRDADSLAMFVFMRCITATIATGQGKAWLKAFAYDLEVNLREIAAATEKQHGAGINPIVVEMASKVLDKVTGSIVTKN